MTFPRTLSEWMLDATVVLWLILMVYSVGRGIIEVVDMVAEARASSRRRKPEAGWVKGPTRFRNTVKAAESIIATYSDPPVGPPYEDEA